MAPGNQVWAEYLFEVATEKTVGFVKKVESIISSYGGGNYTASNYGGNNYGGGAWSNNTWNQGNPVNAGNSQYQNRDRVDLTELSNQLGLSWYNGEYEICYDKHLRNGCKKSWCQRDHNKCPLISCTTPNCPGLSAHPETLKLYMAGKGQGKGGKSKGSKGKGGKGKGGKGKGKW